MRVHALECGWLTGEMSGFIAGSPGRIKVPVPVFAIEHAGQVVLFDAGMHPEAGTDPAARLGNLAGLFDVDFGARENVAARLEDVGIDVARIDRLVLSHLHFDHAGGASLVPNARLVVQKLEWEAGAVPEIAARCGFDVRDYQLGHDVELADGTHDLFGDGRVVCIPTHGHTPGHQSLRLRLDDGREVVLCADACYLERNLDEMILPSVVFSRRTMMASLERLALFRAAGASMVYGHDPAAWPSAVSLLSGS
ncbi:MAG TPA: N-acyl homoserine lactonase family protein [Candidatus Binatia bacterium]|jgi:glyoxylase-like metal-dependent hydrolase (beta-lactamase superfamily II)